MDRLTRAERKLQAYLRNPTHRTIEERAPLLKLKDGRHLMFELRHRGLIVISEDFGLTCRERARVNSVREAATFILEF